MTNSGKWEPGRILLTAQLDATSTCMDGRWLPRMRIEADLAAALHLEMARRWTYLLGVATRLPHHQCEQQYCWSQWKGRIQRRKVKQASTLWSFRRTKWQKATDGCGSRALSTCKVRLPVSSTLVPKVLQYRPAVPLPTQPWLRDRCCHHLRRKCNGRQRERERERERERQGKMTVISHFQSNLQQARRTKGKSMISNAYKKASVAHVPASQRME